MTDYRAKAAAAVRLRLEMEQQRAFIRTYQQPDGTFRHKDLLDELQRRNGAPLGDTMLRYWARRVRAVVGGDK